MLPHRVLRSDRHTLFPFHLQKALGARSRRMEEPRREITAAALALSLRSFVRRLRRRYDQWLGWTDRGL